ncbi:MAG: LmeA family phospholipid-binding protein [Microbacteriaceae bacterium]
MRRSGAARVTPRRRGRTGLAVLIVFVVLLAVGAVLADNAARAYAESQIERQLAGVTAVKAHIGGFPFLTQYFSGSLERVEIDAPQLQVAGATVAATVVATGLPVDRSRPVQRITGSFSMDQNALNMLAAKAVKAPPLTLGAGVLSYHGTLTVLGQQLAFTVQLEPRIEGGYLVLTPTKAQLDNGPADAAKLLGTLQKYAIPICIAQYLPATTSVTAVTVTPGLLRVDAVATGLVLSSASLSRTGTCPPR